MRAFKIRGGCVHRIVWGLALAALAAGPAWANGFFVPQQSTSQHGRAFAGNAALAEDASVVFANPAAMTALDGAQVTLGAALLHSDLELSNDGSSAASPGSLGASVPVTGDDGGNPGGLLLIPTLFGATPLDAQGRFWAGMALTAPFGQRLEYGRDWFGRYDSVRAELAVFDFAPALAARLTPWLSLGAGLNLQYATAELTNALPDPFAPGGPSLASDGLGELDGDGIAVGYNLGLYATPLSRLRLGLHYRSATEHELEGDLRISGFQGLAGAFNSRAGTDTAFELPEILTLSAAYDVTPRLTLAAQGQWFGWERFEDLTVNFDNGQPDLVRPQNYRDGWMFGVGAVWRPSETWTFRGGVQYDRTPTTNSFRNTAPPDASRVWLSAGASWHVSRRVTLDFAVTHVEFEETGFDTTTVFFAGTPLATPVTTRGRVDTRVTTFGVGVSLKFP